MKYAKKQLIFYLGFLIFGAMLAAAALLWAPADQKTGIVTGVVAGFLITGAAGIFFSAYLMRNPQKAEQAEVVKTEERTRFLRSKTQSAVHSATNMILCAGAFASLIFGRREISLVLSFQLILQILLFICFSTYFAKKY